MNRQRVQLEPAHLLAVRPYRETSLLLEAFALGHGRTGLVARGVRGPRSRSAAALQPLRPLLLSWIDGAELGTLTAVEAAPAAAPPPTGGRVFSGWYINELLLRLLHRRDPNPALYRAYERALVALGGVDPEEPLLRSFEKHLLGEVGYGLRLPDDLDPELSYVYDWEQGPVPDPDGGPEALAGASLIALRDERWTAAALADAKRLLRAALSRQLGERPLRTPALLRELRGFARA